MKETEPLGSNQELRIGTSFLLSTLACYYKCPSCPSCFSIKSHKIKIPEYRGAISDLSIKSRKVAPFVSAVRGGYLVRLEDVLFKKMISSLFLFWVFKKRDFSP